MLAYILCKTEGRRIENKTGFVEWKRADLVRGHVVLEYMEDCRQARKKAGVSFPRVVVCDVIRGLAPLWPHLPQLHT